MQYSKTSLKRPLKIYKTKVLPVFRGRLEIDKTKVLPVLSGHLKIDKIKVLPVLSCLLKIDKTKVLMENGSLMEVESIAECSHWSIMQYFWPALSDNHLWCSFWVAA